MPRPRKTNPKYRFHISGQAAVRIAGRDFYLGPHDSPESFARYYALLSEYNAIGRKLPCDMPMHQMDELISIAHFIADYRSRELPRIEHNVGDHGWQSNLLALIETKFGDVEADDFSRGQGLIDRRYVGLEVAGRGNCVTWRSRPTHPWC